MKEEDRVADVYTHHNHSACDRNTANRASTTAGDPSTKASDPLVPPRKTRAKGKRRDGWLRVHRGSPPHPQLENQYTLTAAGKVSLSMMGKKRDDKDCDWHGNGLHDSLGCWVECGKCGGRHDEKLYKGKSKEELPTLTGLDSSSSTDTEGLVERLTELIRRDTHQDHRRRWRQNHKPVIPHLPLCFPNLTSQLLSRLS